MKPVKKLVISLMAFHQVYFVQAQNVGIGIAEPKNKLEVLGNVLINTPLSLTNTPPLVSQTYTMVNATTIYTVFGDSTGRIYDPGGPSGNYVGNLSANLGIEDPGSSGLALEITIENIQLGTGDSLILRAHGPSGIIVLAVGNGYSTPGKWVFNSSDIFINFKSNADANNGSGFSILYRRLFSNESLSPGITAFAGRSLFFEANTGALRSGYIGLGARGYNSFATGINNTASGEASIALGKGNSSEGTASVAMGLSTKATANGAIALGLATTASGDYASAIGSYTTASGNYSIAIGRNTSSTGSASMAAGFQTTASGDFSTAMGSYVSSNHEGSFLIGDKSTTSVMNSTATNNFRARFTNGYRFYTSANYSTSCSLGAGDNAWTTTSDVRRKEHFAMVDGEEFLKKIAGFNLTSWNYKTQDPKTFRHYGPMAQDFFAAFGKDEYGTIGNDTTINSADFAGVSFIAIQALEKRTQNIQQLEKNIYEQQQLIETLKKENAIIKEQLQKIMQSLQLKK